MADRRRVRRAVLAATAVAAAVLGGAGCAGVPTSGPVHVGNPVPAAPGKEPFDIRQIARGPVHGQKPDDIVRGFLTASASVDENHAVARTYLSDDAARTWQPDARVLVYDNSSAAPVGTPQPKGRSRVVPLRAPSIATIDPDGGYTVAPRGARLSFDITVVQQQGEWRISNPPPGVLLTPLGLTRSFERLKVYFLDRTLQTVVPDDVFLASSSDALATALLRRLLRGPTGWLGPAVRTSIPAGTLLAGSAPVDDHGVVTVDLTREALASTADQRTQLSAQIGWTLRQLPGITGVRLLVEGSPMPGVSSLQDRDAWSSFDPSALSANATGYYRTGDAVRGVDGTALPGRYRVNGTTLDHLALSPSGTYNGGLLHTPGRTTLYIGGLDTAPRAVLSTAGSLTAPSWDAADEFWVAERSTAGRISVVRPGAAPSTVSAPELSGRFIDALRVSRDGTRVAVITGSGAQRALVVGRVRADGKQGLRLDGFRAPAADITAVIDVSWADPSTIAVLGARGGTAIRPWLVRVDGAVVSLITTAGVSSYDDVAAAPGQPTLVASRGVVYIAQRGVWSGLGSGSQPAYPG